MFSSFDFILFSTFEFVCSFSFFLLLSSFAFSFCLLSFAFFFVHFVAFYFCVFFVLEIFCLFEIVLVPMFAIVLALLFVLAPRACSLACDSDCSRCSCLL